MKEIRSGKSRASINPKGAYVESLALNGREVLMKSPDGKQTHGGMAALIPYANRVRDAEYIFDNIKYELPRNDGANSIHGLTRDVTWETSDTTGDPKSMDLRYTLENEAYPSIIAIDANYSISDTTLNVLFSMHNLGPKRVPLVMGAHPYFKIAGNWEIKHSEDVKKLNYSDGYFPDGTYEEVDFNKLESLNSFSFDNCYYGGGILRLVSDYGVIGLERRNMPYFVLYNGKHSKGESVALEPMTGAPDAFNNGIGLLAIEPSERFACGFAISIQNKTQNSG